MNNQVSNIPTIAKLPKPPSLLQELEARHRAVRAEMIAEKKRIKQDRNSRRERIHVLTLLGKVIDQKGKSQVATVLEHATCLNDEEKLAVEYYYKLRERPITKKPAENT